MLKTYKIYNSLVRFSKYKFNNKLLGDIILNSTLYIYIYIYISFVLNFEHNFKAHK